MALPCFYAEAPLAPPPPPASVSGALRRAWRHRVMGALMAVTLVGRVLGDTGDVPLPSPGALKNMTVEQLLDLDVTSVSRHPERLFGAASAIQVITADDVRRSGASSLPEALRLASNLEVAQIDSRQWAITARGFNNVFADKLLVMIDGRSVYTPLYAGVYWDAQDMFLPDLDRIEVISGPGGTQWGANAVNGVIAITSKSAKDTQGGLLTGTVGNELRHSVGARYGGTVNGVAYRIYVKQFDRGESIRPAGRNPATGANDSWRKAQGGFRADWDASADDALTLQGDVYDGSMGQVGPDNIRINGANLLGRWSHAIAPGSDFKLQVYHDRTHRRIPGSFTQDLNTSDLDFQHRFAVGTAHDVIWGFGYRVGADNIANTPANAFLPPRVTHDWMNLFVRDEIALVPNRLALTLGSKFEHNDYTGFETEPSGRLSFTPTRRLAFWTAVSRAVRTPSRIDRDLFSPATPPYRIAGGTQVVSEKLFAYEAGTRMQLTPQLNLSTAFFYNDYRDLRSLDPLNPPFAFPVITSSDLQGWSAGAEFTAEWRFNSRWRLHAGYTELRVHTQPQPRSDARGTRDSIAHDPNQQFRLRSLWDVTRTIECDIEARYVGPIPNPGVPGYTEADARVGWSPNETWEFSVVGQNLLHNRHVEFYAGGARREIERGVSVKAAWRF